MLLTVKTGNHVITSGLNSRVVAAAGFRAIDTVDGVWMRTTITLDLDAFKAAEAKAAHDNVPLGKAVSLLILQVIWEPIQVRRTRKSSAVFRSEGGFDTDEDVQACL